jgi:effector-binding domain-containing protein
MEPPQMGYEIDVLTVAMRRTAVVGASTTWTDFPRLWPSMLDQVHAFLHTGGVRRYGQNIMLYKGNVRGEAVDVEVGVEVPNVFAPTGRVEPSILPAGVVARTVHRGPYADLGAAHFAVREWCLVNGRDITGMRWEVYGDWREDPESQRTEIYYLLGPQNW